LFWIFEIILCALSSVRNPKQNAKAEKRFKLGGTFVTKSAFYVTNNNNNNKNYETVRSVRKEHFLEGQKS